MSTASTSGAGHDKRLARRAGCSAGRHCCVPRCAPRRPRDWRPSSGLPQTGNNRRMALKSTIYKAQLQIADMDRQLYADHSLTLAQHPSETDERLMMRVLAFALHVPPDDHDGALEFGKGLSDTDEPDLWRRNLTGGIEHWIDL